MLFYRGTKLVQIIGVGEDIKSRLKCRSNANDRWRHYLPSSWAVSILQHSETGLVTFSHECRYSYNNLFTFLQVDALCGGEFIQSEDVRHMFISDHITYNIENCRMVRHCLFRNNLHNCSGNTNKPSRNKMWQIIAPVRVDSAWHCYVWDFKDKVITVLDPTRMGLEESEIGAAHTTTVSLLHDSLFACKNTFFCGWSVTRKAWVRKFLTIDGAGGPR